MPARTRVWMVSFRAVAPDGTPDTYGALQVATPYGERQIATADEALRCVMNQRMKEVRATFPNRALLDWSAREDTS